MRIGIDMMGMQSPGSRERGIGRYTQNLVSSLVAGDSDSEYFLYFHAGLPQDPVSAAPNVQRRVLQCDYGCPRSASVERLVRTNADGLDLLLITSPFETCEGYAIPARPLNGPRVASVVYDVIPAIFHHRYLTDPDIARSYYRNLETLCRYDLILTISSATKSDYEGVVPRGRLVRNISSASDGDCFQPAVAHHDVLSAERALEPLGVRAPFVFNLGGALEWRKNFVGLLDAFRTLPDTLRRSHQLVVTCALQEQERACMLEQAASRGVADQLVLTGAVSDATLRSLYQRCAAFVFPSIYEGFGLPILEALHCGAPVVAGNNSSQIEVAGDAGLLANVHDPADVADKIEQVLQDRELAAALRARARLQARRFSWRQTAQRARDAFHQVLRPPRPGLHRTGTPRPKARIAYFSPLPPKRSGISDYSANLLCELKQHFSIDVFHDAGYVPHDSLASTDVRYYDYRLYPRHAAVVNYHGTVYQMGNSEFHRFVYETLQNFPGVVTLHDLSLAEFHRWYAARPGVAADHLRREVEYEGCGAVPEIAAILRDRPNDHDSIFQTCVGLGIRLNRRVLEHATRLVVHSRWALDQLKATWPGAADRAVVIPHGAYSRTFSVRQRHAVRSRFDIPQHAFVCASFGSLHPTKMNVEALAAFAPLARTRPEALFLFVGADLAEGEARAKVLELGLSSQVRFLGHQPSFDHFRDLCGAVDVALNLRRPPTNGETSGSMLLLLGAGVPTVVTAVDTMAGYPDDVVVKVPFDENVVDRLKDELARLAGDVRARERLAIAAQAYVSEHHDWSRVARLYAALIDGASEPADAGVPVDPTHISHTNGSLRRELLGQAVDGREPRTIGPLRVTVHSSTEPPAQNTLGGFERRTEFLES